MALAWAIAFSSICSAPACCCTLWTWPRLTRTPTRWPRRAIVEELRKYDESLYNKPRWLVLNKLDMVDDDERTARVQQFLCRLRLAGKPRPYADFDPMAPRHFVISALTGEGTRELTYAVMDYLDTIRQRAAQDRRSRRPSGRTDRPSQPQAD